MSDTINMSSAAVYGFKNSVSIQRDAERQSKPVLSGRKQSPGDAVAAVSVTVADARPKQQERIKAWQGEHHE